MREEIKNKKTAIIFAENKKKHYLCRQKEAQMAE